jgi:site-specific DNA-methyltransferase (adenine-specific)
MNKLYQGDCLEVMDKLITEGVKVDAIITDPPYNIARDNNFNTMGRAGIDFGEWDKGFDLFSWIDKGKELLSKNGSMVIFNDWKNIGDIAKHCESKGLVIKDMLRWEKLNPMPRNRDRRYITDFEVAVWVTNKNAKWIFNRQDKNYQRCKFVGALTSKSEKTNAGHPTQKPIWLMENILQIHTNENNLILDPFMGSGTTGVACKNLNRDFIGIELDKKYFKIAEDRINELE